MPASDVTTRTPQEGCSSSSQGNQLRRATDQFRQDERGAVRRWSTERVLRLLPRLLPAVLPLLPDLLLRAQVKGRKEATARPVVNDPRAWMMEA